MGLAALFLWLAPEGLALGAGAYLYFAARAKPADTNSTSAFDV